MSILLEDEPATAKEISNILLDFLVRVIGEDAGKQDTISKCLFYKLCEALVFSYEEAKQVKEQLVSGEEAEEVFGAAALEAYRRIFPETKDTDGNLPMWPDLLPYEMEIPRILVKRCGALLGREAALATRGWYAYCAEERRREEKRNGSGS
jgi:hypothetical protein